MTNTQITDYIKEKFKEEWVQNALIDRIINLMLYDDLFVKYNLSSPIKRYNFKQIEYDIRKKVSR